MAFIRRILGGSMVAAATLLSWGLGVMSTNEGHVWFDPYIDTRHAPGYRPELEKRIAVGMSRQEVEAIIGEPLDTTSPNRRRPGLFGAIYTLDGGHDRRLGIGHRDRMHKDFAWHYYTIMYDSVDVVRDTYSGWAYD